MFLFFQIIETEEDQSKFIQLYETYRGLLYYIARQSLQSREDAEDLVHQVFVKIAENIKIIAPPCPKTKGLVVLIIKRLLYNAWKAQKRRPQARLDPNAMGEWRDELPVENALAACVLRLPEQQKQVVLLKYHYGYSLREIAALMGISLPSGRLST